MMFVGLLYCRFNQQNKHLRFGNYVFGPVVMRMYYFLNQPKAALELLKDPELEGFFDQLSSYQVLCDLLYNNGMYQEVLDVFEIVKSRQVSGTRYPRNVLMLVFASCYKMVSYGRGII
jgi:pentatricopeptide repeat domain-containing protein 2